VSRAPHTFRQSDLTRAIRAAVKAGVRVVGATVDRDGQIQVIIAQGDGDVLHARDASTGIARERIARMKSGAGR